MTQQAPDHTTHTPIKVEVPKEEDLGIERAVMPTPSLWQDGCKVQHKQDRERFGHVRRVDHMTRQFRLVGVPRTAWETFDHWDVLVEKSEAEKAKDAAREQLQQELAALDPEDLAAVEVFCDDVDPSKALAKFEAMRKLGIIGGKKAAKAK